MVSSLGIKAIMGLIPIYLHLQKLSGRSQLRVHTLLTNHILRLLIDVNSSKPSHSHFFSLSSLTKHQCSLIKDYINSMNNRFHEVFPSFDPINPEFQLGNRIIDNFSNCVSFHLFSKNNNYSFKSCIQLLDNLAIEPSNSPNIALMVIDASVKKNVALSIAHIHIQNKPMVKTLYHVVNVTSFEAKFFAIRCGINQAVLSHETSRIIIVMDSIYVAKKIFNSSLHML